MKKNFKGFGFYALLIIALAIIVYLSDQRIQPKESGFAYLDMIEKEDDIARIDVTEKLETMPAGEVLVTFKDGTTATFTVASVPMFEKDMNERGIKFYMYDIIRPNALWAILPWIVMIGISVFLFLFILNQSQGGGGASRAMSFGKSRAKMVIDDKNKVTFKNVAGLKEEKEQLEEVVDFLKGPAKYTNLGARIPKGVILVGPPGTGKTLLAKAVAGEARVPFFSISGSDFVEMFVGVGASRVRDLFEQAKKNSPCIVFIDEIDAVGRRRGAGLGGGHDEREQTLNQLLVEMDGFNNNEGVIIMAATNRVDILDPAILRPGRFDRRVHVGAPDVRAREEILKVHAKGKPISDEINFLDIARTTAGFTGADLENLLNEAAIRAARENKRFITSEHVQSALVKVVVGTEKRSRKISDEDKKITAYHEAGHAIIQKLLPDSEKVHSISIISTGPAGGYTMHIPTEDRSHMSKGYMIRAIQRLLGGRAAEKIIIEDITTGASNDIERATKIARNMVVKYGMSDVLGPIMFGEDDDQVFIGRDWGHTRNYGENVAGLIDSEIRRFVEEGYETALNMLQEHIDKLHAVANALLTYEKITGDEFERIFNGESVESVFEGREIPVNETEEAAVDEKKVEEKKEASSTVDHQPEDKNEQ